MNTILKTQNFDETNVSHGFFTKLAGHSNGVFSSLNCSRTVGDDELSVTKNLKQVQDTMQSDCLFTLKQVHGNEVVHVTKSNVHMYNQIIEADALITDLPHVCLGVLTADCAPVLLYDKCTNFVAAIHCGWKSARKDIIQKVIDKITEYGTTHDIYAAIGPCVHVKSYVVQEDFKNEIEKNCDCFEQENSVLYFNLPKYVYTKLQKAGINNISIVDIDTVSSPNMFFSYRNAMKNTDGICGRQISCIMKKIQH